MAPVLSLTYRYDKQIWLQHGLGKNTDMYRFYLKIMSEVIFIWKDCSVLKHKQQAFEFSAMTTHLRLSPTLAGIGKATLCSVALEPPCVMKYFSF